MGEDTFAFIIVSSGFLGFVNLILLIVALVQKKIKALGVVIVIVAAFVLPLIGVVFGMLTVDDNPFASIALTLLGMVFGFAAAMWFDFIYLLVALIRKPTSQSQAVETKRAEVLDEVSEDDEII